jgi:oligopeptide/dipeptide ABC transporter ATP-binding protein
MSALKETIAVQDASVLFPVRAGVLGRVKRHVRAVDGVSLSLHENETVALVGESGSGKTTLGHAILGLRPLTSGGVLWRGKPLSGLTASDMKAFRRDVQVVFQDPYASLNPKQSIAEALRRPLKLHRTMPAAEMPAYAARVLDKVGLRPAHLYLGRYPHEFSGGQRQRIAIARALMLQPTILVADEPVSALDVSIRAQILKLLQTLKAELKLSMLFLSHDLGVVRFIADRVAVMYLGKLVEIGPSNELFLRPHHPYTRMLLSAAPSIRRDAKRSPVEVLGEPPPPSAPPSGCRFRTRCPHAFQRCVDEEPLPRAIDAGHLSACHLDAPA